MLPSSQLALKGKPTKKNLKEIRKHELVVSTIEAMGRNPDLPFIFMALGGAAVAAGGVALDMINEGAQNLEGSRSTDTRPKAEQDASAIADMIEKLAGTGFFGIGGWALARYSPSNQEQENAVKGDEFNEVTTWVGFAAKGMEIGGTTISAAAWAILFLRAIFANSSKNEGGVGSMLSSVV